MQSENPGLSNQDQEDEELLRIAIEESKEANPNTDNMTYEQLLELGDRVGMVSKGLGKKAIQKIPVKLWRPGATKTNSCSICFDDFST